MFYIFLTTTGQRVDQCYCIQGKKFDIDVMAIAGRNEKMAKLHEKITWSWKCKEQKWVANMIFFLKHLRI